MNLRCIYCQTPFTLSRAEMLTAIIQMNERNMNHYDAHCPRCRRANSISRQRMELFFPNWQEAAKQQASAPAAPVPAPSFQRIEPPAKAVKTVPAKKPEAVQAAPKSAKAPAAKKPAAKAVSKAKKTGPAKPKPASKPSAAKKKTASKGKKK
jgi:hypothetical protein